MDHIPWLLLNNQRDPEGIILGDHQNGGWLGLNTHRSQQSRATFPLLFRSAASTFQKMFLNEIRLGRIEYVQMKFYTTVVGDVAISWTYALLITSLSVSQKCCGPKLV